ncbi:septal ring lytic transglycosylase RlpA family protein [Sphaerisporangium sp. B11E5]|uniref:septal ring lytic transglycosylase RlpA family protein n=1 Tax=Sphaerisporangium sp. B11E5 TaxID=3153563 RepID=UPI00325CFD53
MGSHDSPFTARPRTGRRLLVTTATLIVATGAAGGAWILTSGTPAELTATATVANRPTSTPALDALRAAPPTALPSPPPGAAPEHDVTSEQAEETDSPGPVREPIPTRSPVPKKKAPARKKVLASGSCGASFYDEGQMTASGEPFNPGALTAAHKSLPMGSIVRVVNPGNGKSVKVRINDRGPFIAGRCLDLSRAAFDAIGSLSTGAMTVRYQVLAR